MPKALQPHLDRALPAGEARDIARAFLVVHLLFARASYTQSQRSLPEAQRTLPQRQAFHLSCLQKNSPSVESVVGIEKEEFPPMKTWQKGSKNYLEVRHTEAHFR